METGKTARGRRCCEGTAIWRRKQAMAKSEVKAKREDAEETRFRHSQSEKKEHKSEESENTCPFSIFRIIPLPVHLFFFTISIFPIIPLIVSLHVSFFRFSNISYNTPTTLSLSLKTQLHILINKCKWFIDWSH